MCWPCEGGTSASMLANALMALDSLLCIGNRMGASKIKD